MNNEENSIREITRFVTEVRALLQHLESELVTELTSDLEANISLSVADGEQIPNAHDYVQELLSAAGLEVPSLGKRSRSSILLKRMSQQLRGLAPMWWLLRAFIACIALAGVYLVYSSRLRLSHVKLSRVFIMLMALTWPDVPPCARDLAWKNSCVQQNEGQRFSHPSGPVPWSPFCRPDIVPRGRCTLSCGTSR